MKNSNLLSIASIFLISVVLTACSAKKGTSVIDEDTSYLDVIRYWIETEERVPYYSTLYFKDGMGYEFKNPSSNKLIITLDGGGDWFGDRIGEIGEKLEWNQIVNWLLPFFHEYNIFVPEKFHWGRKINPFWDIKNRERYTLDNLIANYASVISEYLSKYDYETIIIFGHSEGGVLAPELYFLLEDVNISAIISSGAGGLISPSDISAVRRGIPMDDESINQYLETYKQYLAAYSGERYADSPEEQRFRQTGQEFLPWNYFYSLHKRRPFEFYKNIDIPVLFIHGLADVYVSPVSTRYVEQNLPDKPFTYIYYPDSIHYPDSERELVRIRADIANWLKEKGL
jgi:pimeloyl-ACP methyl ester carboxylesterase